MNRTIVDEIIALGRVRVQKVFGLFGHVLVMEIFSKEHRRLYFVFDHNRQTRTLHVQSERPIGQKSKSPFIALITKYATAQVLRFYKLDEDGTLLKAVFTDNNQDYSLIFETDAHWRAGLFREQECLSSLPFSDAPIFRAGFLVTDLVGHSLEANGREAEHYHQSLMKFHRDAIFSERMTRLKQMLAKKKKLLKNVEDDLARCKRTLEFERDANLLKAHMHQLKRGMKEAMVMDYEEDPPAQKSIVLDAKLSPQEFVNKLFARVKKAKRGMGIIANRLDEIRASIASLEHDIENDDAGKIDLTDSNNTEPFRSQKQGARLPYRQFRARDSVTLWAGKSAKDSDAMLRLAKGNEWFFHARDVPGAHVIVKSSDSLSEQTVYEAALLAHHFSKHRSSQSGTIQYTRVKYVHKKKGLLAGKVIITQEKTIEIDVDENILKELLARQ